MISIKAKKHDSFSVEFKFGFVSDGTEERNDFEVNTWLFIPNSMGISPQTYGKDQFYRDIKSNVRLITPPFTLQELASGDSLPAECLKEAMLSLAGGSGSGEDFEYHLKMFAAIFKSALRDSTGNLRSGSDRAGTDKGIHIYVNALKSILSGYRNLYRYAGQIPDKEKHRFSTVDEYLNHLTILQAIRVAKALGSGQENAESLSILTRFILDEKAYASRLGFESINGDPMHDRDVVYNHGIQKKYIESDLYINLDKRKDGVAVEQLYYSIAAGIAMIFATAVGWATQVRFGNITGPLFVVLVVSYMMKDRIKDLMRYWFAHKLVNKYFDKKARITIGSQKVGEIKEAVDFVAEDRIPAVVSAMREKAAAIDDESRVFEEKVLLYRKHLVLDSRRLQTGNRYPMCGINEIMRLHFNRFMQKMDNPEIPVSTISDDGEISTVKVQRIYCVHIVFQFRHLKQSEYRHLRVIMNRNGILKVEDVR